MEEEYDFSDVDLDEVFDKDELWGQIGKDLFQTVLFGSALVLTRLPSPVDEWEDRFAQFLKYSWKDMCGTAAAACPIIFVSLPGTLRLFVRPVPGVQNTPAENSKLYIYTASARLWRGARIFRIIFIF